MFQPIPSQVTQLFKLLWYTNYICGVSANFYSAQDGGTLLFIKSHPSSCYWPAPPVWSYPTTAFFDPKALSSFLYWSGLFLTLSNSWYVCSICNRIHRIFLIFQTVCSQSPKPTHCVPLDTHHWLCDFLWTWSTQISREMSSRCEYLHSLVPEAFSNRLEPSMVIYSHLFYSGKKSPLLWGPMAIILFSADALLFSMLRTFTLSVISRSWEL